MHSLSVNVHIYWDVQHRIYSWLWLVLIVIEMHTKQVKTIFHWENYLYLINNFLKVWAKWQLIWKPTKKNWRKRIYSVVKVIQIRILRLELDELDFDNPVFLFLGHESSVGIHRSFPVFVRIVVVISPSIILSPVILVVTAMISVALVMNLIIFVWVVTFWVTFPDIHVHVTSTTTRMIHGHGGMKNINKEYLHIHFHNNILQYMVDTKWESD